MGQQHFFYREQVEVTRSRQIQTIDSYKTLNGILYPAQTTIRDTAGNYIRGMKLVEITDEFDDSVFRVKEKK